MRVGRLVVLLATAAIAGEAVGAPAHHPAAGHAAPAPASGGGRQSVTGPVATYWMSAATTSGMGGMGMGGGGGRRPSFGAMMMGGGMPDPNAYSHTLVLQLGSSQRPAGGGPNAEHDPPRELGAGAVLPLTTPQAQPKYEEHEPAPPAEYRQPHGRMLIFWGCGEHAPPGQPYVIDFARLGSAAGAQQFSGLMRNLGIQSMQGPSPGRSATYGEWPNERTRTQVPAEGSLQGHHTVKGNYSPQIDFDLTANQDFLPPFRLTTNEKDPQGAGQLAWRPVDGSQGYFATMFGARGEDEMVMWTSSAAQASAFGMPEYLSDGEISRLVAQHALMAPSQTACTIPAEAVKAAGDAGFFQLTAFGGESNIAYPPRPPAPRPWNIEWQVKVRYRSATSGLVGMDMARMMGGGDGDERQQQGQRQQQQKPKKGGFMGGLGGLGGMIP